MNNTLPPQLEHKLLQILRDISPLPLHLLLGKLGVSQFDSHVRDLIWQLIDQGKIKLTDDRQLEYVSHE